MSLIICYRISAGHQAIFGKVPWWCLISCTFSLISWECLSVHRLRSSSHPVGARNLRPHRPKRRKARNPATGEQTAAHPQTKTC